MSNSDWADELAAGFVSEAKAKGIWQDELAAALRAAERRGRIAGLRDAENLARGLFSQGFSFNCEHWETDSEYGKGRIDAANLAAERADELEKQD